MSEIVTKIYPEDLPEDIVLEFMAQCGERMRLVNEMIVAGVDLSNIKGLPCKS